jgi:hypothetical protein
MGDRNRRERKRNKKDMIRSSIVLIPFVTSHRYKIEREEEEEEEEKK